jgi:hypothetical protein
MVSEGRAKGLKGKGRKPKHNHAVKFMEQAFNKTQNLPL